MDSKIANKQEELLIEGEFNGLINDYLNSNHRRKVEIITKAFALANEAHKGARRRSGEPYILHPIAVARIVCKEIGLGSTSICAALLHDVVEDTDYTVEDIRSLFGDKIAQIVDGLTKISSGMFGENVSSQAENFRKLLLTMSDDIRVILVKIADRLHNMRTLGSMLPAKRFKIAGETMYIYAPLAYRLGLFAIKTELEELSFKYENPDAYNDIIKKLEETNIVRTQLYKHFAAPVIDKIDQMNITYEIHAREKSIYSIWNKMQSKNVAFEDIYDIFAVRIIFDVPPGVDEKKQCWDIYSAITDIYKLRPDRIRDWVSRPKSNGYQALHLTVMGPDGQWIEVQIRSRRMDDIAEKGFAAHWKYKEGKIEEDTELDKWLKTIKEILENPNPNAIDFLDTIKLNLFALEIFVFTPKGEIKTLPQGATALDFAYELHSNIGDKSIGAKVNHKLVPLSHKLQSGDQIEILTSKTQQPHPEWMEFVTTAKSRTRLENSLRKLRREFIKSGEKEFFALFELTGEELTPSILNRILDYYSINKKEDLFYAIANNEIELPDKAEKLLKLRKQKTENVLLRYMRQAFNNGKRAEKIINKTINQKETYLLKEEGFHKNFTIAPCCHPIPGDNVLGYVSEDNEVIVHKVTCPIAMKLKASFGNRIISTEWGNYSQYSFLSTLTVTGIDKVGMLKEISTVISTDQVNIKSLSIESNDGVFEGKISLYVHNVDDVQKICSKILKINGVKSVNRLSD
ncbi:MAG: bifunctional (p)ppGpp synthetase/guanosine-3',5'-bis(diphosphate) 3'-pyrophosphohydrolase [Dysgonamonadaceae bacterium]